MKKVKKLSIFLLLLLWAALLLAACGTADGETGTQPESTAAAEPAGGLLLVSGGTTEYRVVRGELAPKNVVNAAKTLFARLKDAAGESAQIVDDWINPQTGAGPTDYEICVGDISRNGKYYTVDPAAIPENSFTVRAEGTRLVIVGHDAYGTEKAVEWFIAEFFPEGKDLSEVVIPADFAYTGSYEPRTIIRYMTQNLLAGDDEYAANMQNPSYAARCTADLAQHTVAKRTSRVLGLIRTYQPDSLGVQECSSPWRTYFDKYLPTIGYARIGADKNQKIGIIYNTATVRVFASGSFWLTEHPEHLAISNEWGAPADGLTERLGMYVVFEIIRTGDRYIHFNTHLDTAKNSTVQGKQTEVLLEYIDKVRAEYPGVPVVMTGDFNYNKTKAAYTTLVGGPVRDAKGLAVTASGAGSFNKFIGPEYADQPIDQMLITPEGVEVLEYRVLYDKVDGCFISDHYAVLADFVIKK